VRAAAVAEDMVASARALLRSTVATPVEAKAETSRPFIITYVVASVAHCRIALMEVKPDVRRR
jgi:hypothetical protein